MKMCKKYATYLLILGDVLVLRNLRCSLASSVTYVIGRNLLQLLQREIHIKLALCRGPFS